MKYKVFHILYFGVCFRILFNSSNINFNKCFLHLDFGWVFLKITMVWFVSAIATAYGLFNAEIQYK